MGEVAEAAKDIEPVCGIAPIAAELLTDHSTTTGVAHGGKSA
jgi:hypothetical protein